jgi:hypothetical protein
MRDIADDLAAWGVPILPVLRLSDSDAQLSDAGYAAESHEGQAVVRLGDMLADPDDEQAESHIDRLRNCVGLSADQCDLVVDLFEIRNERDVTRAEPVVRKCVAWATRRPCAPSRSPLGRCPRAFPICRRIDRPWFDVGT